jgi:hypothetical protein
MAIISLSSYPNQVPPSLEALLEPKNQDLDSLSLFPSSLSLSLPPSRGTEPFWAPKGTGHGMQSKSVSRLMAVSTSQRKEAMS